jgi:hypothetical protein
MLLVLVIGQTIRGEHEVSRDDPRSVDPLH